MIRIRLNSLPSQATVDLQDYMIMDVMPIADGSIYGP